MTKIVNKFLTKTYHMITQGEGDQQIVSWTGSGDSFTIHDIGAFENETLPKYFNHSKFSSFVRQLNFYGFQKLNLDTDLTSSVPHTPSNAARFSHDFFRRGMPELLPKIQRSTAKAKSPASVESDDHDQLQKQVEDLKNQLNHMQQQMDMKLEKAVQALQSDYIAQVARLELNYKSCIQGLSVLLQEKLSPSVSSVLHNLQRLQASGCLNT